MELKEELNGGIYEMRENERFYTLEDIGKVAKNGQSWIFTAFPLVSCD